MKMKLLAFAVIALTLTSTSLVYGFEFVPAPKNTTFDGFGYVFAVEYECGAVLTSTTSPSSSNALAQGLLQGNYSTNILIHGNGTIYVKLLDAVNDVSLWVYSTPPSQYVLGRYRFVITSDGLLDISCSEILQAEQPSATIAALPPVTFSKGLLIISQPAALGPTALNVVAAYTFVPFNPATVTPYSGTVVGGSQDVVTYSGTFTGKVPTPCVSNPSPPPACQLYPQ